MKTRLLFFVCCFCLIQAKVFSQSPRLRIRLERALHIAYQTYDLSSDEIKVSDKKTIQKIPANLDKDHIYKIRTKEKLLGYAYLGQAPSKERDFDYLLLFNKDLKITMAKVLIYREQRGNAIGNQRWLKQFEGMSPASSAKFKENIDGISGATISARSMTAAVDRALTTMGVLEKAGLL